MSTYKHVRRYTKLFKLFYGIFEQKRLQWPRTLCRRSDLTQELQEWAPSELTQLIPFPLPVTVQNSTDWFRNGQMPSSGSMILWGSLLGTSGNSFLPSWENHGRDFYILMRGTAAAISLPAVDEGRTSWENRGEMEPAGPLESVIPETTLPLDFQ